MKFWYALEEIWYATYPISPWPRMYGSVRVVHGSLVSRPFEYTYFLFF